MKIITGLLFACLLSLCCSAQDMTAIFGNMPKDMILLIDSIQRQDLMDLYKNEKIAVIKDNLNETVSMTSFSDDFLELKSGNSSMQIVLLNLVNNSKIICLIQTVCAPVCDSRLSFYTHEWEPLEASDFLRPVDFSWFIKDNTDRSDEGFIHAIQPLSMDLMQYSFDPANKTLTQNYTTPQYLSADDKKNVEPYLKREAKIFKWEKMRFR